MVVPSRLYEQWRQYTAIEGLLHCCFRKKHRILSTRASEAGLSREDVLALTSLMGLGIRRVYE
eukprot:scaffold1018_cov420-Prasinococcus_capsulatus_cf.AAC.14